jgi:uncharacterized protein YfiM (DUF2279 family)
MNAASLLCASLLCVTQPGPPPDRWFAEDKARHFFTSFAATSMAGGGARVLGIGRDNALLIGIGFGAAAGVGKEVHDARSGGRFSIPDLVWDVVGMGAAFLLLDATR